MCVTQKLRSKIVILLLLLQTDLFQAIRCSWKEPMREKKGVLPCLEFLQFMQCTILKCLIAKVHTQHKTEYVNVVKCLCSKPAVLMLPQNNTCSEYQFSKQNLCAVKKAGDKNIEVISYRLVCISQTCTECHQHC